ncbi:Asp-tRNA(Asn)/Glu-tRNA(Gln) amidotransferase C subunit/uncharacterized protein YeaO (DUF488 family) [Mucilaginibacter sp. UYP25]|uniref:hypothetical protein n=1 Tax=unclassified Mucilaginibacter TaxID=2617802 RepID=UPI00339959EF
MKFDFGFSMYFLEGPELSTPEKFFIQVQHKLQIYKKHTETTIKLYQDEFKEQLLNHKKKAQEAMAKANEAYELHYEEIVGSDQDKQSYATHESGIDELQYHFSNEEEALKNSFSEMADHFNKSALVTLYALMETELRRLCSQLQAHYQKRVSLERFEQADYLKSIMEYLDQIIELDISGFQPYQTKIIPLQFLRNKVMHNGGEFPLPVTEYLDDLVKTSDGGLSLEEIPDEQFVVVRVRSKFVFPFYELISEMFYVLFALLNEKENFSFLSSRLAYVFRFLAPGLTVTYKEHKSIKNGQMFTFLMESRASENPFSFFCKFTIVEAAKEELIFTNQLEHNVNNIERLIAGLAKQDHVMRQVMAGFLDNEKAYRIEFMLYCNPPLVRTGIL